MTEILEGEWVKVLDAVLSQPYPFDYPVIGTAVEVIRVGPNRIYAKDPGNPLGHWLAFDRSEVRPVKPNDWEDDLELV